MRKNLWKLYTALLTCLLLAVVPVAAAWEESEWITISTQDRLCQMALDHYEASHGYRPPEAECIENEGGSYTIHLCEDVDDGDGSHHTTSFAWYTVDRRGDGTDDILAEPVALWNPDRLIPWQDGSSAPVKVVYRQSHEGFAEFSTEDAELMAELIEALQGVHITDPVEEHALDATDEIQIQLEDGRVYNLEFEAGHLVHGDERYGTEGFGAVNDVLRRISGEW